MAVSPHGGEVARAVPRGGHDVLLASSHLATQRRAAGSMLPRHARETTRFRSARPRRRHAAARASSPCHALAAPQAAAPARIRSRFPQRTTAFPAPARSGATTGSRSCGASAARRGPSGASRTEGAVVFLGDSITQGWGGGLGAAFPGVKVANRGISGDTTRGVLHPAAGGRPRARTRVPSCCSSAPTTSTRAPRPR